MTALTPFLGSPLGRAKSSPAALCFRLIAHVFALPDDHFCSERHWSRAGQSHSLEAHVTSKPMGSSTPLGSVRQFALKIYRDPDAVERFLSRPHLMLQDRRPIDVVLEDEGGAITVISLLGRAAYGGSV